MTRRRLPKELELEVRALGDDGLGRGVHGERQVHARNALPGERVQMRVLQRRRGIWYGEADTPAVAAAERRQPACVNYPRCGGCAMQHIDYAVQLEHKSARLRELLTAQGVTPQRLRPPVAGPRYHYRFKARLGARLVGDNLLVGYREGLSNRVVRMTDCKTLAEPLARALPLLRETLDGFTAPQRIPQVELAAGDGEQLVIVRHLDPLPAADLARLARFAQRTAIHVCLQGGGPDSLCALDPARPLPTLSYANPDFGLVFEFGPTDFTQVNPYVNRALVQAAVLALAPRPGARIVDLFCGIGNFSLALARAGGDVQGFESVAGAIARARHNARRNGLCGRAEFTVTDLYDSRSPDLPGSDGLLLDPPRSGAGPNLERWVAPARLARIAYVSCNPTTFASDAARLAAMGFVLAEVGIFDMFPHTAHVETLGVFVRPGATAGRG